jgi:hypothetical protein
MERIFSRFTFLKAYDSTLMEISLVFILSSKRFVFNKKLTLKIDSADSTGRHG